MDLTIENKRDLASLKTVRGFHIILTLMQEKIDTALQKVKTSKTDEEILEASKEYRFWEDALTIIRGTPDAALEELKQERDEIYG
jgi:hypothetical protein